VADRRGALLLSWGDPETVTYMRSTAKPIQALPLVESGALSAFGLTPRQLALVCASHAGTDEHVQVVESIQRAIGVRESDLRCGVHPPHDRDTAARLLKQGVQPGPNRHNCSGKHTGMLAVARHLNLPARGYTAPDHPVQTRVLDAIAGMTGVPEQGIGLGIDGCSVPTFAVPLRAAATALARLADPRDLPAERRSACGIVFRAMTAHPDMVSGRGRFDTRLMEVCNGRLIAKGGAEGFEGLALAPGATTRYAGGVGVAIKVADGDRSRRAVPPITMAVLEAVEALSSAGLEALADFGARAVENWRGLEVGSLRPVLKLRWKG
jgi:L-asparaginase II